jgi:hypothetical protein
VKRAALTPRHAMSRPGAAAATRSAPSVGEARFALAPHVFACVDDSHVVLLDLRHDEYYTLDRSVTRGLSFVVPGWPGRVPVAGAAEATHETIGAESLLALESLLRHGLLVSPPTAGKRMEPVRIRSPERDLRSGPASRPRVTAGDVARVTRAILTAVLLLRCCSIHRIVQRILSRKRQSAREASNAWKQAQLADRVARFERLRPLFFSARDACLLDSLALLEFLASHGMHADWVFGVRTRPFAAHCWVQSGDAVCNDEPERVCRFTPILVA